MNCLMTNFDLSPMLNRQLSLELPAMESATGRSCGSCPLLTGRLPRVWDWPQD